MNRVFITLVLVFVVLGGLAVFQATRSASAQVLLPSELLAAPGDKKRIQIVGRVAQGEIAYRVDPDFELRFAVEDPKDPKGTVPVVYRSIKPDMFAVGRDVILKGEYIGGLFAASEMMTQCPSKYEAPSPEEKYSGGSHE